MNVDRTPLELALVLDSAEIYFDVFERNPEAEEDTEIFVESLKQGIREGGDTERCKIVDIG